MKKENMKLSTKGAKAGNKEDIWYIEFRPSDGRTLEGDALLHIDKACKAAQGSCEQLVTADDLTSTLGRDITNTTMCTLCIPKPGYRVSASNIWESSRFRWQAEHINTAQQWIAQISQPGWVTGAETMPALLGLLLKTVADHLEIGSAAAFNAEAGSAWMDPEMWIEHPALRQIRGKIRTQIACTLKNHPYTRETALEEACVLGAKEIAVGTISGLTCNYDLGEMHNEVYTLLENWYNSIHSLSAVTKATKELRQTALYQQVLGVLPKIDNIVTRWEETFIGVIGRHPHTVFYTTHEIDRLFRECPHIVDGAIELLGLKGRTTRDGIGELPELAIYWLTRMRFKPDAVLYTAAVKRDHQHLTDEQWDTVTSLWGEAQYGPESVYTDASKAIDAALVL